MAVYTKLDTENFNIILSQYDIGELINFAAISEGVENTNYSLETSKGRFVLTIFEKRVQKQDLPFYLNLINYLEKKQFPCPQIYRTKNNSLTFSHKTKLGIVISFLDGSTAEHKIAKIHCIKVGEMLAHMHLLAGEFGEKRKNDFSLNGLKIFYQKLKLKKIIKPDIQSIFDTELSRLSNLDYSGLPKGIIHADFFPDNVFFNKEEITGVIDFYFSCNDYLIFDIAVCINAWCFDEQFEFKEDFALALLQNYNNVREISEKEISMLKDFCILTAIRFYFTRIHDQFFHDNKNLVEAKDPAEYLKKITFFNQESPGAFRDLAPMRLRR